MLLAALGLALCLLQPAPAQAQAEDSRWIQANALTQSGRFADALPLLEALVADAPDAGVYRLELASVLLRLGQGQRARFHFAQARGGTLPPEARRTVEGLLAGLPLRSGWERSLSFSIAPESNPARGSSGFILINGVPVEVGTAGAGESGRSASLSTGALYLHALSVRTGVFGGATLDYTARSGPLEDTGTLRAQVGFRTIRGATRIEGALRFSQHFVAEKPLAHGPGLTFNLTRPLGRRGTVAASVHLDRLQYRDIPGLDGTDGGVTLGYVHALSPATRLSFALGLGARNAVRVGSSTRTVTQSVGIDHAFRGGLSLGATVTRSRFRRDAPTGFFTVTQSDRRDALALRVSHARIKLYGFAPVLELARERQDSNIPLQRYDNTRAALTFTRRF